MVANREELQRRITKLEADMPDLIAKYGDPGAFNSAFAGRADEITDNAGISDDAWAFEQIDRLLEKFDLWHPRQGDLPSDE